MKQKEKKVNIALKENVHLQAKIIAVVKGINLSSYLEQAIQDAIKKDKKLIENIYIEKKGGDSDE